MVNENYFPERGDIVWLNFNPQSGHEQKGKRPAIVVSPKSYNSKVGMALFCPITSRIKNYPFEVALPAGLPVSGVILSDQIKSLDWRAREIEFIAEATIEVISETLGKLNTLLK